MRRTIVERVTCILLLWLFCDSTVCLKKHNKPWAQYDLFVVSPSEMVVTWVTMQSTNTSVVEYGISKLNRTARGREDVFIDGGRQKRVLYIHRVTITGLGAGQKYCEYCCHKSHRRINCCCMIFMHLQIIIIVLRIFL